MRAIGSRATREVHVRVAADGDDIYIDLADRGLACRARHGDGLVDRAKPAGAIPPQRRNAAIAVSRTRRRDRPAAAVPQRQRQRFRARGRVPAGRFAAERPLSGAGADRRARHGQDHVHPPVAQLGRSEHGAVERIAVQRSRPVHRRPQRACPGVRKRLEVVQCDVGLSLPSCDRRRGSHPRAVQGCRRDTAAGDAPDHAGRHRQLYHPRRPDGPRHHPCASNR